MGVEMLCQTGIHTVYMEGSIVKWMFVTSVSKEAQIIKLHNCHDQAPHLQSGLQHADGPVEHALQVARCLSVCIAQHLIPDSVRSI